jgi:hypothetical protein
MTFYPLEIRGPLAFSPRPAHDREWTWRRGSIGAKYSRKPPPPAQLQLTILAYHFPSVNRQGVHFSYPGWAPLRRQATRVVQRAGWNPRKRCAENVSILAGPNGSTPLGSRDFGWDAIRGRRAQKPCPCPRLPIFNPFGVRTNPT